MDEQLITTVVSLCEKLGTALDRDRARMDELEQRLIRMEVRQRADYSQSEAARITGWSTAAIGNWIAKGFVDVIPGFGRNVRVPACEIDKIIARKGYGPKHRMAS